MNRRLPAITLARAQGQRFALAREAMAAVEFALLLPFMLILLFGVLEISHAYQIKQRVALAEHVLGDLVGRSRTLTAAQIDDIFAASGLLMAPYDESRLTVTLRAIRLDASGDPTILWARASDGIQPSMVPPTGLDGGLGSARDLIEISLSYPFDFDLRLLEGTLLDFGQTAYVVPRGADLGSWNGR